MQESAFVLLLLLLPILFFLSFRVRAGKAGELRPLPGVEELAGAVGRSAETGRALHVSVGVAGIGGPQTAETWAGLTILSELADEAASCNTPLIVTVADPTVLPLAQEVLWRAYLRNGNPEDYDPTQVRFIAPNPLAYSAGVAGLLLWEPLMANVMVGTFGDEVLLMGEVGARAGVRQVAGTANPQALPLVVATADRALIGEEIFAGGAYMARQPLQVASLLVQDWARWAIAVAIVLVAVAKMLL
jgi:hypothetical protein